MGYNTRWLLSHRAMWCFGLRPCELEKAFPGAKITIDDMAPSSNIEKSIKVQSKIDKKSNDKNNKSNNNNANDNTNKKWANLTGQVDTDKSVREELKECGLRMKEIVENAVFLESEENNEYLWKYFALLVDRLLFFLSILGSLIIGIFMLAL